MGLYIHIPFCLKKCHYCDFLSFSLSNKKILYQYVYYINKEVKLWYKTADEKKIDTLYIGGGTPSLLPPHLLRKIMSVLSQHFSLDKNFEFTIEANPGTLTYDSLKGYVGEGVNRISLGVQSFDAAVLKKMGRTHGEKEVEESVVLSRKAGIRNLGFDLIYGLPEQTLSQWENTLKKALEMEPEHVSVYGLSLENQSLWALKKKKGELFLPDQDTLADMYFLSREILLAHGYEHYEISNFAKPGFRCRHNLKYWRLEPYIGIGLGATSYIGKCRINNFSSYDDYYKSLEKGELPFETVEKLSLDQEMAEFMFLGLRTAEGVDEGEFFEKFEADMYQVYGKEIKFLLEQGILWKRNGRIMLNPCYYPVANEVFLRFI